MQFNCKCVNSICGWQDMCQLQKGKLLKCEQQMCSCKSIELLMFQWHMNKTANVVTAKDFNCLCIQLQMCYQQMYDLQMKNCICSNGQCSQPGQPVREAVKPCAMPCALVHKSQGRRERPVSWSVWSRCESWWSWLHDYTCCVVIWPWYTAVERDLKKY